MKFQTITLSIALFGFVKGGFLRNIGPNEDTGPEEEISRISNEFRSRGQMEDLPEIPPRMQDHPCDRANGILQSIASIIGDSSNECQD
ncbi:hypothetical protein K7432_006803 [Basidiobolus ranarum]|uniref:Uncharacterized protein n=1 Tax=Basidiobolus ranarum TaxID=34480 RepID=A0ABR2W197_9FUNG